ncbi:hypothetical protein E5288_WYG012037 [Bos mutus]|uniref:Uncharacterized protein n=1 Tax=Bos mutus TaxID=72004 RepID=A0A6B0S605_9CETA|nr:hypothetical protein [Bos mutus]
MEELRLQRGEDLAVGSTFPKPNTVLRSVGLGHRFRGSIYEPKMQRKKLIEDFDKDEYELMFGDTVMRSDF